jgi:hypothetical protein
LLCRSLPGRANSMTRVAQAAQAEEPWLVSEGQLQQASSRPTYQICRPSAQIDRLHQRRRSRDWPPTTRGGRGTIRHADHVTGRLTLDLRGGVTVDNQSRAGNQASEHWWRADRHTPRQRTQQRPRSQFRQVRRWMQTFDLRRDDFSIRKTRALTRARRLCVH